jgi:hypothetical protein
MRIFISLIIGLVSTASIAAIAQQNNLQLFIRDGGGSTDNIPPPPPPRAPFVNVPFSITPPPTPPPVVRTPPPVVQTPQGPIYFGPQPIDVTNDRYSVKEDLPAVVPPLTGDAVDGLIPIADSRFPDKKSLKGSGEWILVRGEQESKFTRPNEYTAKLEQGTILVSVRRPSQVALVETPIGDVALHADGDVMLAWNDGVLRIFNISAIRSECKAKFENTVFGDSKSRTVTIRTGYEVVACADHKLGRAEMRPSDGVARRRAQLVADGHIGVSEFSVESMLQSSLTIAHIAAQHDPKDTRILGQMSKMAAVLNVVNSPYGYTKSSPTGLASTSQTH